MVRPAADCGSSSTALLKKLALDVGDHQILHKPFDKGGLSGPHRPDDPDVDVAAGAPGDVCIDVAAFHALASLLLFGAAWQNNQLDKIGISSISRLETASSWESSSWLLASSTDCMAVW